MNLKQVLSVVRAVKSFNQGLTGLCALLLILSMAGCSRAPEDPAWFQSTTSGDILSSDKLMEKINQVDSFFKLYNMKREYILRGGESSEIMEALDKRRDQLAENVEAFPAVPDKLDFMGWDIQKIDGNKYRLSCYFIVIGKMESNWILKISAGVDEKDAHLLPPENQKSKRVKWQLYLKTSTWDIGEHKILSQVVELQPIPYYIYAVFFTWPEGKYCKDFIYGWFSDVAAAE